MHVLPVYLYSDDNHLGKCW